MTLDLDDLLSTIDSKTANIDLRSQSPVDNLYYQCKDARTQARNDERKLLHDEPAEPEQHWQIVKQTAIELLGKQTKDLEVASWLCEALVRLDGINGLDSSLALIAGLCEQYWDTLFPMPDEDGLETRLAPIIGLNGEDAPGSLVNPIYHLAITADRQFSFWQYQQALVKKNESNIKTLEEIETLAQQTEGDFYQAQQAKAQQCLMHLEKLSHSLELHCAEQTPMLNFIRDALQEYSEHCQFLIPQQQSMAPDIEKIPDKTKPNNLERSVSAQEAVSTHLDKVDALEITPNSRQQTLQELSAIADYFRRNEPHSPLPYLLDRAVHWGKLSLPELMQEMIVDSTARDQAFHLTGIVTSNIDNQSQ